MQKIAIIHFSPIELYPPVTNWLHFLEEQRPSDLQVKVFTRRPRDNRQLFKPAWDGMKIIREGTTEDKQSAFRYFGYIRFYVNCFLGLLRWKPTAILYYETLSAWPALWYKQYVNTSVRLFVHYHEYISPAEYSTGMKINRLAHRSEQKWYPAYSWISHTNPERMTLFKRENPNVKEIQVHILPNYPPRSWQELDRPAEESTLRIVYVGALSLGNMYTEELARWVIGQQGRVNWDIYSNNMTPEARSYLDSLGSPWVKYCGAIEYYDLPQRLKAYNAGVILYKGTIPNYVFNAPNKLFEYLACGLDVWYPAVMISIDRYKRAGVRPQVLSIDFEKLDSWHPDGQANEALRYEPTVYCCEQVLPELYQAITGSG